MKYTKEHELFFIKHEVTPRKKLTKLFNKKFNAEQNVRNIAQKCRKMGLTCPNDGCFKKGSIPSNKGKKGFMGANKTSFAKGNIPPNVKKTGTISYRKDKSGRHYAYMKLSEPNKWKILHVYIWEQKYGEIPKGHCIIFKDKDTLNTNINNLMLVSRAELARLNQKYAYIDKSLKDTALQIIKINEEIRKKGKK